MHLGKEEKGYEGLFMGRDERRDSMWGGGRGTEGHSRDCDLDPFVSDVGLVCVGSKRL